MAELNEADMIWNRACGEDPLRALPGDRALADLLYAHGLVMNGGVLHAVGCMTAQELFDAGAGYQYYGLNDAAFLLSRAAIIDAGNDLESQGRNLDSEYGRLIPSDSSLTERFDKRLKTNPLDFGPFRPIDRR